MATAMSRELAKCIAMVAALSLGACKYHPPDDEANDGPELPTVFFASPTSLADEGVARLMIPVKLSEPSTSTVDFKVTGGVATAIADFTFLDASATGTLTFAGDTVNIEVGFSNDNLEEPNETIELTLENPQGATLGDQITHVITISADILPRVKFTNTATNRNEDLAGAKLDLELDIEPTAPVSIDIALGGAATAVDDYALTTQTVSFAVGQKTAQLDYGIVADLRDETDELIAVDLVNPVGVVIDTSASHTEHTIKDDDASPTVFFATPTLSQSETVPDATQTVQLSAASNLPITVQYAQTGSAAVNDVTVGGNGTLTFAPGVTTQTIPVTIINDPRDENTETVVLTLSAPTNATLGTDAVHTLSIQDNDNPPTITFGTPSTTVTEGDPRFDIAVNLVGETELTVTVDFARAGTSTAVNPGDFTFDNTTGSLTFAPGVTTQNIGVAITDDTAGEADETLDIVLSGFTNSTAGATTTHSVTIVDDDCFGTGNFRVCLPTAPNGNKNLSGTFNTDGGSCEAAQPVGWTANQPAACFVVANTITVTNAGLNVTGSRPLVLVAATSINVIGVLDASGNGAVDGPAGPSSLCNNPSPVAESSATGGGGGAGASFMTKGGNGGDGNNSANDADGSNAQTADTVDPAILRGGCRGGDGGTGPGEAGGGGGAGGAVYLVAPSITIGGTIDVSGSGGRGAAPAGGGGGGGGAGGMIFLDASTTLTFSGTLMSNGGGGGQGADLDTTGQSGGDPTAALTAAPGGNAGNAGGAGGNGFRTGAAATAGTDGAAIKGAGGGGGGGGFIKSTKSLAGGTVSAGKILP